MIRRKVIYPGYRTIEGKGRKPLPSLNAPFDGVGLMILLVAVAVVAAFFVGLEMGHNLAMTALGIQAQEVLR